MKEKRGITLIALIVTIIILLILAGVVISVLNQNGLLSNAQRAKNEYGMAKAREYVEIKISDLKIDKMITDNRDAVLKDLNDFDDKNSNNYTEEITLKLPVKDEDTSSIVIYDGYEIEINSEFTISKINGKNTNSGKEDNGEDKKDDNNKDNGKDDKEPESVKSNIQVTLADGMIPIKYTQNAWYICSKDDNEWFDYEKKLYANITLMDDLTTDKHTNEQIKAMTTREQLESLAGDKITTYGSMFVWIPRYAYKITSGYHQGGSYTGYQSYGVGGVAWREIQVKVSGTTSIKFIDTNNYYRDGSGKVTNVTPASYYDYVVHPAFDWGETKLEGIWIAKYEASASATQNYNDSYAEAKYVPGKAIGNSGSSLDPYIWADMNTCISRAKLLTPASNKNYYGTEKSIMDAHLMKNVDWGAVAYMSYDSHYGVVPSVVTSQTSHGGTMNGNDTGIYDMAGKNWEYLAAYARTTSVRSVDGNVVYRSALHNLPDKYKDYYPVDGSYCQGDSTLIMDETYPKIGDAMYETGRYGGDATCAWGMDYNMFPNVDAPCVVRGGAYDMGTDAGICATSCETGEGREWISFRSTIVVMP